MKYTKIIMLMVIPALVLSLVGRSSGPPVAQAKVTDVLTITNVMCLTLAGNVDWNGDGLLDSSDGVQGLWVCDNLRDEGNFRTLTRVLEEQPAVDSNGDPLPVDVLLDETDNPQPEDFAKVDMDAGQLHEDDQTMYIVAFVKNDDPMGFYADKGVFNIGGVFHSSVQCGPAGDPTSDFTDEDCDGDGVRGDGVVAVGLQAKGAKRGPAEFTVRQDQIETKAPYTIVGEPHKIELSSIDPAVQVNAPVCELFSDTETFLEIAGEPETTPIIAKVTDSDGTSITGALVVYSIDENDEDLAELVIPAPLDVPLTPSLDLQALGFGSPEVLCGGSKTGTVKITATLTDGSVEIGAGLDPNAEDAHDSIEVPVQGPPEAMTLSVDPAGIACDGTASATVSATLTDSEGNPVVNGNRVDFDVQTLGTANPISARTVDGVATSTITPLAGLTSGVVVTSTSMRHVIKGGKIPPTPEPPELPGLTPLTFVETTLVGQALVSCEGLAAPPGEVPPAAVPSTVISPPNTGDGGSHSSSLWLALPLSAVALVLLGSGLALRRRTR